MSIAYICRKLNPIGNEFIVCPQLSKHNSLPLSNIDSKLMVLHYFDKQCVHFLHKITRVN